MLFTTVLDRNLNFSMKQFITTWLSLNCGSARSYSTNISRPLSSYRLLEYFKALPTYMQHLCKKLGFFWGQKAFSYLVCNHFVWYQCYAIVSSVWIRKFSNQDMGGAHKLEETPSQQTEANIESEKTQATTTCTSNGIASNDITFGRETQTTVIDARTQPHSENNDIHAHPISHEAQAGAVRINVDLSDVPQDIPPVVSRLITTG